MFGEILGFKRFTSSLEVIRRSQQTVFGITDMPKPQTFCRRSLGQVSYIGLACAIEARKAGASVLVLEKMRAYGGNSTINGGIMSVPGNAAQNKLGIKDSPELLAEDMIREGLGYNYPDKVLTMAKQAMATYEWTVNELHVEWIPDRVGAEGGHSVPRHLFTVN